MSDFSIWYILYCERGHNRHIYWSPPQMEITYERHDGLWQSDWSRYTRINNSKKKNPNKSPSLHIYWRCTEIADYSEIAKDNIIIAFYVFYHPFVSSWWVFFGYGTHQPDLPYQMKGNKKKTFDAIMLFNPVLSYRNKFLDKCYLDSRPIRDVSFRFSTNERRFISISDQWDVFYFDSRPMRYVLFRYPTNKRRLISIPDQSGMFHLDFRPMRDALFRCATNEMFYFDSQPMKDVLFRFANRLSLLNTPPFMLCF